MSESDKDTLSILQQIWAKIYNPNSACPDIEIDRILDILAEVGANNHLGDQDMIRCLIENKKVVNIKYHDYFYRKINDIENDFVNQIQEDEKGFLNLYLLTNSFGHKNYIVVSESDDSYDDVIFWKNSMFHKGLPGMTCFVNRKGFHKILKGTEDLPDECDEIFKVI